MDILRDGKGWQPSDHKIKTTSVCAINLHPWLELGLILENKCPSWVVGLGLFFYQTLLLKKTSTTEPFSLL